jgi:hypothetical protein
MGSGEDLLNLADREDPWARSGEGPPLPAPKDGTTELPQADTPAEKVTDCSRGEAADNQQSTWGPLLVLASLFLPAVFWILAESVPRRTYTTPRAESSGSNARPIIASNSDGDSVPTLAPPIIPPERNSSPGAPAVALPPPGVSPSKLVNVDQERFAEVKSSAGSQQKFAFGLTASQLEKFNADLGKAVGFNTKGMRRNDAVSKITARLGLTLTIDGALTDGDDKIEEDLADLSCGTALACILRPIGFCMVPHESGETLAYTVKKAELGQEVWPIGWPAENTQRVLPGIYYETHNVNISSVPAAKVLAAIGANLKVPVLYDHNGLARHGIDPYKTAVSYPQQRTTYGHALFKMLATVRLKFEVRVDEAGKPFLWITSSEPLTVDKEDPFGSDYPASRSLRRSRYTAFSPMPPGSL